MIQIRRRWPILAALAAGLSYGANHYQIAGIEHLHLKPREAPTTAVQPSGPQPAQGLPDLSQIQVPNYASTATPVTGDLPVWKDQLTVGEKLAVLEGRQQFLDQLQSDESNLPDLDSLAGAGFPVSAPIPVPPGFVATDIALPDVLSVPQSSLPSTSPTVSKAEPAQSPQVPDETSSNSAAFSQLVNETSPVRKDRTVRVASFNVQSLHPSKLHKSHVAEALVAIIRQYDIVALQEVQSPRDDLLPMLVDRLNQSGRKYDYLIGPRVGRSEPYQQFAIVFDAETVETDRYQLYTVDDPEDLLGFDPLVAWFRCKGVPQEKAFTFSLANLRIDPVNTDSELAILPNLLDAIRQDGRQEDDWILVGDFDGNVAQKAVFDQTAVRFALRDIPTNVEGTQMLDGIYFPAQATSEFTGRSGTYDFLRKFNLSIERALEISDHMPVWAEFSIVEGAEPGRLAPLTKAGR